MNVVGTIRLDLSQGDAGKPLTCSPWFVPPEGEAWPLGEGFQINPGESITIDQVALEAQLQTTVTGGSSPPAGSAPTPQPGVARPGAQPPHRPAAPQPRR